MINKITRNALWIAVFIFLALSCPLPIQARIGESYNVIVAKLGQPNVEQTDKGIYSWAVDEKQCLFLAVIFNKDALSVAEQLRSHEGPLEEDKALQFFKSQLGRTVAAEDFTPDGKVQFAGSNLNFGKTAQIFLDQFKEILCVWQEGNKPSASVYSKEGAALRMGFGKHSTHRNI